jgi:acetyltransferase-like isoleucine patch superfamily enzyme/acyl carrier protein
MVSLALAQAVVGLVDRLRSRAALRAATRIGEGVRLFGWPRIVNEGELTIGSYVSLLSTPSPVEFVVAPGATMVVAERALIESGASLRARGTLRIGRGARIGAGCIVGDDGKDDGETTIGDGAWIEDGVVVPGGTNVPAGTVLARRVATSAAASVPRGPTVPVAAGSSDGASADIDRRLRAVLSRVVAATSSVDAATELTQVKGWDSLAALRALVALEKEFAIVLPITLFAERPSLETVTPVIAATVAKHAGVE